MKNKTGLWFAIGIGILMLIVSSCASYKTCPTYAKNDLKVVEAGMFGDQTSMVVTVIIIAFLVGSFIGGIVKANVRSRRFGDDDRFTSVMITIVTGVVLFIMSFSFVVGRYSYFESLERLNAFKATLEESRKTGLSDVERVAILKQITEWNESIAAGKYQNEVFDLWVPDEIEELKPIK